MSRRCIVSLNYCMRSHPQKIRLTFFFFFYSVSKLLGSALWRETAHSVLGSIGFSFILWATAFSSLC